MPQNRDIAYLNKLARGRELARGEASLSEEDESLLTLWMAAPREDKEFIERVMEKERNANN